jgi:L-asparaginase II
MACIADPSGQPPARAQACARVIAAMTAHPELVGGTGRACTLIMRQAPGIAVKTGAEGVYIAILPALGLGAALKIEDGASRASETVLAALLIALGVVKNEGHAFSLAHATVLNTRGVPVGERRVPEGLLAY